MIMYVKLVVTNFAKSAVFYDAFLAEFGGRRIYEVEGNIAWSTSVTETSLSITEKTDSEPAPHGDGYVVAFDVESPEEVDRIFKNAIALGATSEEPPEALDDLTHYIATLRDPDGHQLRLFCVMA